jgi:hypothetical protein
MDVTSAEAQCPQQPGTPFPKAWKPDANSLKKIISGICSLRSFVYKPGTPWRLRDRSRTHFAGE